MERAGIVCVNLPRWGLKLLRDHIDFDLHLSVNLPRWGLKQNSTCKNNFVCACVNLPRWVLKLATKDQQLAYAKV